MNFRFTLKKLYYTFVDTSSINLYRLLLLAEEYQNIGRDYFCRFYNTIEAEKTQNTLKHYFFRQRELLCKDDKYKDCRICSESFRDFYVERSYHFEQYPEHVIQEILEDIENIEGINVH